jgi:hypothetical protein
MPMYKKEQPCVHIFPAFDKKAPVFLTITKYLCLLYYLFFISSVISLLRSLMFYKATDSFSSVHFYQPFKESFAEFFILILIAFQTKI